MASFAYLIIAVYSKTDENGDNITEYEQSTGSLGTVTVVIAFVLNVLALLTQTPYLYQDTKFVEWVSEHDNKIANHNENSMTGLQERIRDNDDHDSE